MQRPARVSWKPGSPWLYRHMCLGMLIAFLTAWGAYGAGFALDNAGTVDLEVYSEWLPPILKNVPSTTFAFAVGIATIKDVVTKVGEIKDAVRHRRQTW